MVIRFNKFAQAIVVGLTALAVGQPVLAQASAAPSSQPAPEITWAPKATHANWTVICPAPAVEGVTCQAVQVLETKVENASHRVLKVVAQRGKEGLVLSFELPFGLDLRPGMVFQIDQHTETVVPYLTCLQTGCVATQLFQSDTEKVLAGGKQMKVGFRPLGSDKVMAIDVNLEGVQKSLGEI